VAGGRAVRSVVVRCRVRVRRQHRRALRARPGRLRVPFVVAVGHGRRRRTYEYWPARVLEQVLEQRHFDRSSAAGGGGGGAGVHGRPVVVAALRRPLRLRRRRLHRVALARRTVRQVVRQQLFRFRVDVRRPPDAHHPRRVVMVVVVVVVVVIVAADRRVSIAAAAAAVVSGLRRRVLLLLQQRHGRRCLVLVPFQYGLGPPVRFRRTVDRFGRR